MSVKEYFQTNENSHASLSKADLLSQYILRVAKIFFLAFILASASFNLNAKERPIVSEISAIAGKGSTINVSWTLPVNPEQRVQRYFIYRSSSPIGTYYDLSYATLLASVDSSTAGYVDSVKNYNDYYYAVIAQVNGRQYDIILPSINSTVNGVHLILPEKKNTPDNTPSAKEKIIGTDELRETPLPYLNFAEYTKKKPRIHSVEVKNAAKSLVGSKKKEAPKYLEIYVFEEDLISPEGGDDFLLFDILKNTFIQKKYSESWNQLETLLGARCALSVQNRALFYLGESQYYCRDYENAVRTFLRIYDIYPSLAKKWIDSSLDLLDFSHDQ